MDGSRLYNVYIQKEIKSNLIQQNIDFFMQNKSSKNRINRTIST